MRTHLGRAAVAAALLSASLLVTTTASAGPVPKATGGVELSSPMQFLAFNAFDHGSTGDRGTVAYTNFEHGGTGSGVWSVLGTYPLVFSYYGDYTHSMTVTSITPKSPTSTAFEGTGSYPSPATDWTVEGTVEGSAIAFHLVYTSGPYVPYSLDATGTIAADGSMSGTSSDSLGRTLPWTVPASSVHEVFSYTVPVTCAKVDGSAAWFAYTSPTALPITWKVTDGGSSGAGNDTAGFSVTSAPCDDMPSVANSYDVVAGNLTVH